MGADFYECVQEGFRQQVEFGTGGKENAMKIKMGEQVNGNMFYGLQMEKKL